MRRIRRCGDEQPAWAFDELIVAADLRRVAIHHTETPTSIIEAVAV